MQTLGSKGQLRSGNQEGMFCSSIVLSLRCLLSVRSKDRLLLSL